MPAVTAPVPEIKQEGIKPTRDPTTMELPEAFDDAANKANNSPREDWIFPKPATLAPQLSSRFLLEHEANNADSRRSPPPQQLQGGLPMM